MSIIRKFFLSLFVIILIAVWFVTGIIAPSEFLEYKDRTEKNEVFYHEIGAVDLTLIHNDNLFKRMQLLTTEKFIKEYVGGTKSDESDINMSVLFFIEAICAHASIPMPKTFDIESPNCPLLFADDDANQAAIFWESCVYLAEENIVMIFMVDDVTGKIAGMYYEGLNGFNRYSAWRTDNILPAIQQTFEITLGAESFSWSDNLIDSEVVGESESVIDYYLYESVVQENKLYYRFPMGKTHRIIAFNMPEVRTPHKREESVIIND